MSVLFSGADGAVLQTGNAFVRLLQRAARSSLQRPLQLPVSGVDSALPLGRVASLAALARRTAPLPQVVYGNVT